MTSKTNTAISKKLIHAYSMRVRVKSGKHATVNIVRYRRDAFRLSLHLFATETILLPWCLDNSISEAMGGGYFLRSSGLPLGEVWKDGIELAHEPYTAGWHGKRGALYIDGNGQLHLGPRPRHPEVIDGHLLEVGPTLVHRGRSLYLDSQDPEGFSETADQHDEDINCKPHPRAAIGCNDKYIWTVTVEGRRPTEAGMFLDELAEVFVSLGATEAINLDGGRSSTQITGGKLLNRPCTNHEERAEGFPIRSAIFFHRLP